MSTVPSFAVGAIQKEVVATHLFKAKVVGLARELSENLCGRYENRQDREDCDGRQPPSFLQALIDVHISPLEQFCSRTNAVKHFAERFVP
jgi:hypothetical protein